MTKQLTEKKQHYLTWSYLKRFAINPSDDKDSSMVYMFGSWSTESQKIRTKSQCYKEIDYTSDTQPVTKEVMKLTEIPFSRILENFEKTKNLDTQDFRLLIRLIVFMHLRTISHDENVKFEINNESENINQLIRKHYKVLYTQHLLTYPRLSEQQILNLDISKFATRFRASDAVDPKWNINLIEHNKDIFLTSDNPVLFFSYSANSSPMAPLMILPISPSKLIVAYHSDYYEIDPKLKLDHNTINFINNQIFNRCNYVVYSNKQFSSKKIDELKKHKDQTQRYDKLSLKKLGINLQIDQYPKDGFSFIRATRKID